MAQPVKLFTLLELLIVITLITGLISLLLPMLIKARESAMIAACAQNERQLYLALTMYDEAQSVLPYGSKYYLDGGKSRSISYDDLLAYGGYDGRELSWDQVLLWEVPADGNSRHYICPAAPPVKGFRATRHYAMNESIGRKNWHWSPRQYPEVIGLHRIIKPEATILLTEHALNETHRYYMQQKLGSIRGAQCKMQQQVPWRDGLVWHRSHFANYIMADGHIEFLDAYNHDVVNGGQMNEAIPGGLWKLKKQ